MHAIREPTPIADSIIVYTSKIKFNKPEFSTFFCFWWLICILDQQFGTSYKYLNRYCFMNASSEVEEVILKKYLEKIWINIVRHHTHTTPMIGKANIVIFKHIIYLLWYLNIPEGSFSFFQSLKITCLLDV